MVIAAHGFHTACTVHELAVAVDVCVRASEKRKMEGNNKSPCDQVHPRDACARRSGLYSSSVGAEDACLRRVCGGIAANRPTRQPGVHAVTIQKGKGRHCVASSAVETKLHVNSSVLQAGMD